MKMNEDDCFFKFQQDDYIIEIANGKIRGKKIITTHNKTIYAFLQIPYAAPPIGNLRFKVTMILFP